MKPDHPTQIIFTGGGTGGHLFPGLAVAERLAADWPRVRITFVGSGKAWERRVVAAAGFDYIQVRCRPAPRRLREVAPFLYDNFAGYRAAVRYLGWNRAAVVVGLGGYTSVPMAKAAIRSSVPLLLLEQNVIPGRATRWLAPSAAMVCVAFEQTVAHLNGRATVRVTGNPIREAFLATPMAAVHGPHEHTPLGLTAVAGDPSGPSKAFKQLLILGGSGGARSLNQNVPRVLHAMGRRLSGWKIVHQSGESEFEPTRRLYAATGLLRQNAEVHPFLPNIAQVLSQSDLAICRAGGTTLAELAAAGVPAVLLPFPHAADDHQRRNAEVFSQSGGALLLDERELGSGLPSRLAQAVARLLVDDAGRGRMSEAIRRRAYPDATWDVATMIRHLA